PTTPQPATRRSLLGSVMCIRESLDINPVQPGHTLVIPRQETDYIFDLSDELIGEMMKFSKRVAAAIKQTIPCRKVAMAVLGLEVPHAHIHLIPISTEGDMDFRHKQEIPADEMAELASRIAANFR
ncbi:MAG: HIT family protein, partial [Muribaculaceae bacterium]|nr:HIT family protein [Muribaculaceae bacterium]